MIRIYAANDSNVLTDISQYVNLQTPGVISVTENAEEQSVATASIQFEDPTGTLDLVGLRDIVIDDDLAPFARIFRGQLGARNIKRGDFRAGAKARTWTAELDDLNTRFAWRNLENADFNRPAETDVARMTHLIGSLAITDIVQDTSTYFDTSNPVDMDAADYRGTPMTNLISDCLLAATAYHKNCYLLNVAFSGGYQIAIWYGSSDLTTFSSAIQISNVLADVDGSTTFAPYIDADLERTPERVYDELHLNYDGGSTARTSGTTFAHFFATRATFYDAVNVKTLAKAQARADSQLTTMSTEDDVVTCSILVPSSKVNSVRAGMRIQAKFSHFAFGSSGSSYDTYSYFRVLNRTTTLVSPPDATGSSLYQVDLTLSPQTPVATGSKVLLAFFGAAQAVDADTPPPSLLDGNPWTQLYWDPYLTGHTPRGCGAGPPLGGGTGIWVRDVVPGESNTVLHVTAGGVSGEGGAWVYELSGIVGGAAAITLPIGSHDGVNNGASLTLSASAGAVQSAMFSMVVWGKVGYDGGWCPIPPAASNMQGVGPGIITTTAGNELVNASNSNDCGGGAAPWHWHAYATGTGTLSMSVQTLAGGYGAGAYSCGWNVNKMAILMPIAPAAFSIVQSGFGYFHPAGTVTLPSPP